MLTSRVELAASLIRPHGARALESEPFITFDTYSPGNDRRTDGLFAAQVLADVVVSL
jgi:hypothetical protein